MQFFSGITNHSSLVVRLNNVDYLIKVERWEHSHPNIRPVTYHLGCDFEAALHCFEGRVSSNRIDPDDPWDAMNHAPSSDSLSIPVEAGEPARRRRIPDSSQELMGPQSWDAWPNQPQRWDPLADIDLSVPLYQQIPPLSPPTLPPSNLPLAPISNSPPRPDSPAAGVSTQWSPLTSPVMVRRSARVARAASHPGSFLKPVVFSVDNKGLNERLARCMGINLSDEHYSSMQTLESERMSLSQ